MPERGRVCRFGSGSISAVSGCSQAFLGPLEHRLLSLGAGSSVKRSFPLRVDPLFVYRGVPVTIQMRMRGAPLTFLSG